MFQDLSETGARLFIMCWVAQGAFISFLGVLPAVVLLLHDAFTPEVHTVLVMAGVALMLLAGHVFITGFSTHLKPIRIGAVLELLYGTYLIVLVVIT